MDLVGSESYPPLEYYDCFACCFCFTPNSKSVIISDSFACSWDTFPLTRLPNHARIGKFVPSHIVSCHDIQLTSLVGLLSLEGKKGTVELRQWESWELERVDRVRMWSVCTV